VLALCLLSGMLSACGAPSQALPDAPPGRQSATPTGTAASAPPVEIATLCRRATELRAELRELSNVPLRIANRELLTEEWDEVMAAHLDLAEADAGAFEDALEGPMRELRYRLRDLELAVEDFRTTPNPSKAARHVQDEVAAFGSAITLVETTLDCRNDAP
jgi:hypothetical protein